MGSADVKYVVSAINLKTNNLPPTMPELANRVRRNTVVTPTLCHAMATAARTDVRMGG
jgi:hypothetical protein